MKYPRLGTRKCVIEIEKLFLKEGWFHGRMYKVWLSLTEKERTYIKNKIGKIIAKYIIKDLWLALAKDILEGESIQTKLHIYIYLNTHVFYGNTRKMLVFLQDLLE